MRRYAVSTQHQFTASFWLTESLRSERGVTGSCGATRLWCREFGLTIGRNLCCRQVQLGDGWQFGGVFNPSRAERR